MGDERDGVSENQHRVVIIGAGFAGLGMAIQLRQAGVDDFVILEKSDDVGGCWHDNQYPGAACDIPSHLYSFSFKPKANWSRTFAPQPEILGYLQHCARKYDLHRHLRLGVEVQAADFDSDTGIWNVTTGRGETLRTRVLISACGQLNRPAYPALPGIERFQGAAFHSATWNHDFKLAGKRVAVIGTGASAIQIVPSIIDTVQTLHLFQRHAAYVIPKPDRPFADWEQDMFSAVPGMQQLTRASTYLRNELRVLGFTYFPPAMKLLELAAEKERERCVADLELRRKLTPDYPMGCKRILLSNDYYPALCKPNAEVITDAISHVTERGIVTKDGRERELDAIIYSTGFKATEFLAPMQIRGRDGRELGAAWRDGAEAYLGITVHGFPNLFMLYGPNTSLGHNSIIYMLESQFRYIMACLHELDARSLRYLEVNAQVQTTFNAKLQERLAGTIWEQGCDSWYKTASGKHTNNWPGFTFAYRHLTQAPNFADYERRS